MPLSEERLEEIVEYAVGFVDPDERIDWDHLLLKIEKSFDIDLPGDYAHPEIKRIQRAIRAARREK